MQAFGPELWRCGDHGASKINLQMELAADAITACCRDLMDSLVIWLALYYYFDCGSQSHGAGYQNLQRRGHLGQTGGLEEVGHDHQLLLAHFSGAQYLHDTQQQTSCKEAAAFSRWQIYQKIYTFPKIYI